MSAPRLIPWKIKGVLSTWMAEYRDSQGVRRRVSLRTTDEAEARERLASIGSSLPDTLPADSAPSRDPRLHDIATHYTEVYLPARNAAPRSIASARNIMNEFIRFCAMRHVGRVSQLGPGTVDAWAVAMKADKAAKTIHNSLTCLRSALNAAVDREVIQSSPIKKWLMPSYPEPEIQPLTPKQLARVLAIVREECPRIYPVVAWMAYTGQRPSDSCALTWAQVDVAGRVVMRTQVKTKRLARFEIGPSAAEVLESLAGPRTGRVFVDEYGRPLTNNIIYNAMTRVLSAHVVELGRQVNLKDLRHTFGSMMANAVGCPLPQLQRLMGHARIDTTMRYVKPGDARASVDAFSELLKTVGDGKTLSTGHKKPTKTRIK